jgi:septal ring-binding cell division protein DamX
MKKLAIISLSVALTACVSSDYVTDVSSESYREDYKTQPMLSQSDMTTDISEDNVANVVPMSQANRVTPTHTTKPVVKSKPSVTITPPTA